MPAAGRSPSVGDDLTVAVRANCVRLTEGEYNGRPNQVPCTMTTTEYLGDTIKVHMRAGDESLLAKLSEQHYAEMAALAGKPVIASWDAADVQLLGD
jgi:ABC-type molybdate transport system ATPase subunit